jgi:hypothetical protein
MKLSLFSIIEKMGLATHEYSLPISNICFSNRTEKLVRWNPSTRRYIYYCSIYEDPALILEALDFETEVTELGYDFRTNSRLCILTRKGLGVLLSIDKIQLKLIKFWSFWSYVEYLILKKLQTLSIAEIRDGERVGWHCLDKDRI